VEVQKSNNKILLAQILRTQIPYFETEPVQSPGSFVLGSTKSIASHSRPNSPEYHRKEIESIKFFPSQTSRTRPTTAFSISSKENHKAWRHNSKGRSILELPIDQLSQENRQAASPTVFSAKTLQNLALSSQRPATTSTLSRIGNHHGNYHTVSEKKDYETLVTYENSNASILSRHQVQTTEPPTRSVYGPGSVTSRKEVVNIHVQRMVTQVNSKSQRRLHTAGLITKKIRPVINGVSLNIHPRGKKVF